MSQAHLEHFRVLFSSYYASVRHQRRRELKLLSLPDYFSSCFNTQISCYPSGHLRLVSSPGPRELALSVSALAGCHSYPTSSHGGHDDTATGNKEKRKRKQTTPKQGVLSPPSEEELSTRMVQSGDPLGRKELGQRVVRWLKQGMHLMASQFASSDQSETLWFDGPMGFVMQAQAYLSATAMPKGQEALCIKASTHYPTLFDNFQRELRDVLLQQQEESLVTDWRSARSWMLLKEMAKSAEHRTAARSRPTTAVMNNHTTLGISLDRTRLMQAKIDEFVQKMTGLLQLERDAELEVTQTTQDELSVSSMMDGKPVEYLVTHGQDQEECDSICNLKVISSSTGLTGQHLVLFRAEGSHKLPPTRLSPGDMVCVRTCNSQGEVATSTSCMQGFVHSLSEDGCSITVALKSRRGDPTFSRFLGKIARIDRIQALADAVTYEPRFVAPPAPRQPNTGSGFVVDKPGC